jgi:catechol 2,3-dioxygenase-like lactoylglutathione lyase family enzyme
MARFVGIDHISIRVSDFAASKAFYSDLFKFLGLEVLEEYENAIGWTNGQTRYWISKADPKGSKSKHHTGDIGLHHCAFQLSCRKDVDDLQEFWERSGVTIVDRAGVYYEDYYAVFFLDPDGIKLEGMKYGEEAGKSGKNA